MRRARAAVGILAVLIVAGCGGGTTPAAGHHRGEPSASHPRNSAARSPSPGSASPHAQPPKPAAAPATAVISQFRALDGSVITLATFSGGVVFRLHGGSQDPGYPALSSLHGGPVIADGERRRLLAAFNGGFRLSGGAGGYEQEGRIVSPLVPGLASLVIDRSGAAVIGVWGRGLPRPGEAVQSVRQNLSPLVRHGQVAPIAADWQLWGATLGGGEFVARSALGQDAAGRLIFAGSMSASPAALGAALVHAGARIAMELDINPMWVQLDVARHPGHQLSAAIPGQQRPADQYLFGWTRDFITVLTTP
jgi:hypothetical protein